MIQNQLGNAEQGNQRRSQKMVGQILTFQIREISSNNFFVTAPTSVQRVTQSTFVYLMGIFQHNNDFNNNNRKKALFYQI